MKSTTSANTIPSSNITFYRAVDYNVVYPSDGEGAAGAWPDALIPEVDPFYRYNRSAFPYNVPAGGQMVVWVDIQVPRTQAAGQYEGTVSVNDANGLVQTITIKLSVANFALPSTSSLKNLFPTRYDRPCRAHTGNWSCAGDEELNWKLHALYVRAGLDNRVTISNPGFIDHAWGPPAAGSQRLDYFNRYLLPFLTGTSADVRLPQATLTTFHRYAEYCNTECMNAWATFAQNQGFFEKLVDYTCDEPSATTEILHQRWDPQPNQETKQSCGERLSRPTTLPKLVTTHIQNVPANMLPKIDILVPVGHRLQDKDSSGEPCCRGDQRPAYNGYLNPANNPAGTLPNQLWIYESNMSFGSNGPRAACDKDFLPVGSDRYNGCVADSPGWNSPYWNGWPGYAIDAPALQARAINWLAFQYDISGELYWHTTEKLATAWTDSYEQGGNGDGTLFYPGLPNGRGVAGDVNYAPAIGGPVGSDIPIESIRLKRIRDGREDYEYLKILSDRGRRAEAMPIVEALFGSRHQNAPGPMFSITADSATVTQTKLEEARRALIAKIVGSTGTPPTPIGNRRIYLSVVVK